MIERAANLWEPPEGEKKASSWKEECRGAESVGHFFQSAQFLEQAEAHGSGVCC